MPALISFYSNIMAQFVNQKTELLKLKNESNRLDQTITSLKEKPVQDQFQIQRLKKRQLSVLDAIRQIETALYPDIIA